MVENVPPFLAQYVDQPRRCILATRFGYDICRHFNVKAEAVTVNTRALNATMMECLQRNVSPEEAQELGAWEVAVDVDSVNPENTGYPGHLVLYMEDLRRCVDLDAQQFSRPAKRMVVPDAVQFQVTGPFLSGRGVQTFTLSEGGVLMYQRWTSTYDYRQAPNWKAPHEGTQTWLKRFISDMERDRVVV